MKHNICKKCDKLIKQSKRCKCKDTKSKKKMTLVKNKKKSKTIVKNTNESKYNFVKLLKKNRRRNTGKNRTKKLKSSKYSSLRGKVSKNSNRTNINRKTRRNKRNKRKQSGAGCGYGSECVNVRGFNIPGIGKPELGLDGLNIPDTYSKIYEPSCKKPVNHFMPKA